MQFHEVIKRNIVKKKYFQRQDRKNSEGCSGQNGTFDCAQNKVMSVKTLYFFIEFSATLMHLSQPFNNLNTSFCHKSERKSKIQTV